MKHHIIISGTGRSGTTYLVQLLTALGLDTGFPSLTSDIYENCDAGMEKDIRESDAPYIVKSPWLCDYLGEVLEKNQIIIDHAIIPIRDLFAAAESRRDVVKRTITQDTSPDTIPGGLWHTVKPEEQEIILMGQLYKLIYILTYYDINMTFVYFPRIVMDANYLYTKLKNIFLQIDYEQFRSAFLKVSKPEKIHNFK